LMRRDTVISFKYTTALFIKLLSEQVCFQQRDNRPILSWQF